MTAVNRVAESEDHPCKGGAVHRCVRPRSAALSHAAGRYGDTQTRRRSKKRALSSLTIIAFPGLDLSDQFALTVSSTSLIADPPA